MGAQVLAALHSTLNVLRHPGYLYAMNWRDISWNGIRFQTPQDWEIARIDQRYLLLENSGAPKMEVKWQGTRGPFTAAGYLKRLEAACGQADGMFKPTALPAAWRNALVDFTACAFACQKDKLRARGVVLYCSTCRKVCLVQFFHPHAGSTDDVSAHVLATFHDHAGDSARDWSVFDIRARLPKRYVLRRFCFETGRYELVWQCKGQTLTLMRWGPAAALLNGRKLALFAAQQLGIADRSWQPVNNSLPGQTALQWRRTASRMTGWKLLPAPLRMQAARIWHLPTANRILAVTFKDRRTVTQDLLDTICHTYEAL